MGWGVLLHQREEKLVSASKWVRAGMPTGQGEAETGPQALLGTGELSVCVWVGETVLWLQAEDPLQVSVGKNARIYSRIRVSTEQARPWGDCRKEQRPGWVKGYQGQALNACTGLLEFKVQATSSLLQYPGDSAMHTS